VKPSKLESLLFIDIETVSVEARYDALSPGLRKHWEKKAANLKPAPGTAPDDWAAQFSTHAGKYAEFAKVVCIGLGCLDKKDGEWKLSLKALTGRDEPAVLREFCASLGKFERSRGAITFCGHNIKEFDLPFLARRMVIHGQSLPECLCIRGKKPWEIPHIDTMEQWKFGDMKNFTSLGLLAEVLGIPTPKDDIDGSQVGEVFWVEDNLQRIADYCLKDVLTTARVHLRLSGEYDTEITPLYAPTTA